MNIDYIVVKGSRKLRTGLDIVAISQEELNNGCGTVVAARGNRGGFCVLGKWKTSSLVVR